MWECPNLEVQFGDVEMARLWKSGYRIRVHRSRNDSNMNDKERANSAIRDVLAVGGVINWDKHKLFDRLTEDQIANLTLNQFEEHLSEIMKRNVLDVTEKVVFRIHDAPVLGEFIDARKTPQEDDQLFVNKEYMQNINADTPGAAYFQTVCDFYDRRTIAPQAIPWRHL